MTAIYKQKKMIITIMLLFASTVNNASAAGKELIQHIKENVEYSKKKPFIVFLITKDSNNYEADKTIPLFAETLKKEHGYEVTVLLGEGNHGSYRYSSLEALSRADLLVVFARRIALPHDQMNAIKNYLGKGKPLIGIRTANHAFTVSGKVEDGFEDWPAFVAEILGCQNRGYGPVEPGTDVSLVPGAASHPVVKDLQTPQWHSRGNIYKVAPLLDKDATVLLQGKVGELVEPIAWTRKAGKSRVFYTSLGYPADFQATQFITLLISGIKWALDKNE
ncbi:MAG: ThuA domain-containing protein [Ferruginibacter sp.]